MFDPRGNSLAEPFQPRLAPNSRIQWIAPTAVSEREAVIADGKDHVYRLGLEDQPKPHLAPLAEAAVVKPIVVPPAVLGDTVFGANAGPTLNLFMLPTLAAGKDVPLGGACVWGPARIGDNVLLATDDDQLECFDAGGIRLWQQKLAYGPLAGAPADRRKLRLGIARRHGSAHRRRNRP